ncbi:MAG TPA: tetratricopeptide repeat protein [Polaromonas sp.]|uniref:tetratricopeptide repeat protein n=1 Tax=Polaromonas sp. TaxID=1869339 RepID=UPI002D512019|nr:tetratricopeptide repeat protein [Polaromonas sp.]HYW56693.1 tetratricopeptide repeat protein [Polaromonas sp.]
MKNPLTRNFVACIFLSLTFAGAGQARDYRTAPVEDEESADFAAGRQAVASKNWAEAARNFKKVVAVSPDNADAYNLLGYSSRWLGKYDEAFAAYDKALALNPEHKGALEYSGVAYLKIGQKAKAQAQLTKLKAICATCEETTALAKAIADFKPAAK